jgi:hypothetical protein
MRIGKVVKSNSHCDYVIEVDDRLSVKTPPSPEDYSFGSFVKLETPERHWGVGIIYNTQLFNPAFLNSGPRLSSDPNPIYAPDLQSEIKTLVAVVMVGTLEPPEHLTLGSRTLDMDSKPTQRPHIYGEQGIPRLVVPVNTLAHKMQDQEIYQFHQNRQGDPQFAYYGLLLNCGGSFSDHLIHQVLNEISPMFFGAQRQALEILTKELSWKMTMGAMR